MAKGDGSIQQVSRGKWRVSVSFGKDPVTGRYRRATRTVNGTKADARKVRDQLVREHEGGLRVDAAKVTFGEFARQWLADREGDTSGNRRSERTLQANRYKVGKLCELMGDTRLADVKPRTVEAVLNQLRASGRSGRPLGETSVHDYFVLIRQLMNAAERDDLIMRNPCGRVEAPKKDKPRRRSLTSAEVRRLDAAIGSREAELRGLMADRRERRLAGERREASGLSAASGMMAVRLGLYTGMRLGEVFGLQWRDIGIAERTVRVERSLTNGGTLKEPKTRESVRSVHVDDVTAASIASWKAFQAAELASVGVAQGDETPVCCSCLGGLCQLNNFERWWRSFRDEIGFPGLAFHELRHTHATQMLANGVDVKTVQNRLGHADAALTLNTYAHALPENDSRAAAAFGEMIRGGKERGRIIRLSA